MSSDIPDTMIEIKAFVYDVFGTVVDWKTELTQELLSFATLTSTRCSYSALLNKDWHSFSKKWRNGYKSYIDSTNSGQTPYMTVDSLIQLLLEGLVMEFDLIHLWSEKELKDLVNLWHQLVPYKDTKPGITRLSKKYVNALLSNADEKSLAELNCFDYSFSAEIFRCYIPNTRLYLYCCRKLGLCPKEIAVVSNVRSHLKGVKKLGFKTVFIQREDEEEEKETAEDEEFDLTVNNLEELAKVMGC